jgi:hypothetical protein
MIFSLADPTASRSLEASTQKVLATLAMFSSIAMPESMRKWLRFLASARKASAVFESFLTYVVISMWRRCRRRGASRSAKKAMRVAGESKRRGLLYKMGVASLLI